MTAVKTRQYYFPLRDENRLLIGIISDEETTVGFLLAGIGESFGIGRQQVNYMIVYEATPMTDVEKKFRFLYQQAKFGVLLIATDVWQKLLPLLEDLERKALPIIVEIPTKNNIGLKTPQT